MRGRNRPGPPSRAVRLVLLLLPLLALDAAAVSATELRRNMPYLRPLLMGEAYVAVADEASSLFYNPAGMAWMNATSVEAFLPQFIFNDPVKTALVDPDKFEKELDQVSEDLENENYDAVLGRIFFTDVSIRTPFVIFPDKGLGLGLGTEALANITIRRNRVIPLIRVEFFWDVLLDVAGFGTAGESENFAWGFNLKVINRTGVDETYTPGDIFTTTEGGNSIADRPEWQDVQDGVSFTAGGVDLGFVWRMPFGGNWQPRVGMSFLNIGGYDSQDGVKGIEFGPRENEFDPPQAGLLPQINTVGFAVSPVFVRGIRITLSADVVDFTRTALPGDDWGKRLRLGSEIGLYPHKDGTARFALMAGYNGGHRSFGFLSRIFIFEVGFGVYTVEIGDHYGDFPDERTVFTLGFRF